MLVAAGSPKRSRPSREIAAWFRTALSAALDDLTVYQRRQRSALMKRKSELATTQDRLLDAFLSGTIQVAVYKDKSNQFKSAAARVEESISEMGEADPGRAELALAIFEWAQQADDVCRRRLLVR